MYDKSCSDLLYNVRTYLGKRRNGLYTYYDFTHFITIGNTPPVGSSYRACPVTEIKVFIHPLCAVIEMTRNDVNSYSRWR